VTHNLKEHIEKEDVVLFLFCFVFFWSRMMEFLNLMVAKK